MMGKWFQNLKQIFNLNNLSRILIMKTEHTIKSWYLEDELSGCDQPTKEDIAKSCEILNLPFTKQTAFALIYGDNTALPERIPPVWLSELK